jgi:2-keto-3-deoxy-L-rhamnonate aldolase RhmA
MTRVDYLALGAPALVVLQIESQEAVARMDEILAIDGIDVCFVGPQDLAASLGLAPQLDSAEPRYLAALETIVAAASRHGVPLGILVGSREAADRQLTRGFQMIAVGTDARLLEDRAREITAALAEATKR